MLLEELVPELGWSSMQDEQPPAAGVLNTGVPTTGIAPLPVRILAGLGAIWLVLASVLWDSWRRPIFVVLILLFIVIAHELGHFLVARRAGMACSEFFVGFGPRLWSVRRGATEFGLKLLPLGGYVRILGMTNLETVDPELEPQTFRQAPARWRLATILAGVSVNFLLSFICFVALAVGQGEFERTNQIFALSEMCRTLDAPEKAASSPCPAEQAGIRAKDVVTEIAGKPIRSGDDITKALEPRLGKSTEITVRRGERTLEFTLVPIPKEDPERPGELKRLKDGTVAGLIGIAPDVGAVPIDAASAPGWAASQMWSGTTNTFGMLGKLVTPEGAKKQLDSATGTREETVDKGSGKSSAPPPDPDRPRSIVGIVQIGKQASTVWDYVAVAASINLALGIFNLIPLIPLDGGHAVVVIYEAIASKVKRRRVVADYRKLAPIAGIFIAFLAFLFLTSLSADLKEIF